MFLTNLLKRIFGGGRRVKKAKAHAVKRHASAHASEAQPVKKISTRLKKKARMARLGARKGSEKPAHEAKPEFKRTGPNPFSAESQDPAHAPSHRKMNWKKYQETTPRAARK